MSGSRARIRMLAEVGDTAADRSAYFARHSRTFSLAARLFPAEAARDVSAVYAFCRFTDDLVDARPDLPPDALRQDLGLWRSMARASFDGGDVSGFALLDEAMDTARRADVGFEPVDELIRGVEMDLDSARRYADIPDVEQYGDRVAGTVGRWLTGLFGARDAETLRAASRLGIGMQWTNILRDVGEDLERGRLYLPQDHLDAHDVDEAALRAVIREGAPLPAGVPSLLESLMQRADAHYRAAWHGIPALPPWAQRPVAVAARLYQGIHDAIRANGYDTLSRRAVVSGVRKGWRAAGALVGLPRLRRQAARGLQ